MYRTLLERKFWEEFEKLEEYIEINEKCLDREYEESKEQLQNIYKAISKMNGENIEHENMDRNILPFTDMIPIFHRTYIFLLLYNFIEYQLFLIGETISSKDVESIKQKDLRGQGIKRSHLFFTKVLKIRKPFENEEWKNFGFYNELRNIIIHRNGRLERNKDQKIISVVRNIKEINLSYNFEIMFDKNFIGKVTHEISTFFRNIFYDIKEGV